MFLKYSLKSLKRSTFRYYILTARCEKGYETDDQASVRPTQEIILKNNSD